MKIKSLGLGAIAGFAMWGSYLPASLAQTTVPTALTRPAMLAVTPVTPSAPWYNCLTREVWAPEKQAWCKKVEALQNATYAIPQNPTYVTPDLVTFKLTNGKYEDTANRLSALFVSQQGMILFGDLNGDGAEDAVSLLVVNTGGSGVFTYLVASMNQNGTLKPTVPILLGDRVQVKSMAIVSDKISVSMVTQGANDPMCCPTQSVTEAFGLRYQLVPVP